MYMWLRSVLIPTATIPGLVVASARGETMSHLLLRPIDLPSVIEPVGPGERFTTVESTFTLSDFRQKHGKIQLVLTVVSSRISWRHTSAHRTPIPRDSSGANGYRRSLP